MNRNERNTLVVENLPLVGYLVSDLCARATHLSRDDLASAGALALVTAATAYDPTLGIPFGAYARTRIVGAFADEMRASDWATRSARKRIKETMAVQETLTAGLGRTPTVDEIANALGVDRETATAGLSDAARTVTTLDETTESFLVSQAVSPEESLLAGEQTAYIRAAVEALPERMRYVVRGDLLRRPHGHRDRRRAGHHPLGRVAAALGGDPPDARRHGHALRRRRRPRGHRGEDVAGPPQRIPRPTRTARRLQRRTPLSPPRDVRPQRILTSDALPSIRVAPSSPVTIPLPPVGKGILPGLDGGTDKGERIANGMLPTADRS